MNFEVDVVKKIKPMNTSTFRGLFPTIVSNSLFNDSYLDRVFEDIKNIHEKPSFVGNYHIEANETQWKLQIPLPGLSKEDVKISLQEGNKLTIETTLENQWAKADKREFKLPIESATEEISAEMKNGLLTLCVPKKKNTQDRLVKIR